MRLVGLNTLVCTLAVMPLCRDEVSKLLIFEIVIRIPESLQTSAAVPAGVAVAVAVLV
jgi:hypothetical protein